nr:uncharacterized protein LOC101953713 isoform X2 [Chrysemys picta bellii]
MRSLVLYDKSLSQKIELEAQEAELQHLKTNNKLLQDSVQELQLENGTLKNMNKALEEEKVDLLETNISFSDSLIRHFILKLLRAKIFICVLFNI